MGSQTKTKTCACKNETEQEKLSRIAEVIEEYRDREGSLIQILHLAQGIYGCLPLNVQRFIAERLDIPLSKVSGVVSFYSFFTTEPRGENTIRVCLGTACYVRGGKKIIDKLREILGIEVGGTSKDGKFTLEVMRCIGACGLAPAMSINDKVYKQVNPDKLRSILEQY
jgi:NADH:ubiquinone oxidoreductase subunit E